MRIFRYLCSEVVITTLAVLMVVLVIALLSQATVFLSHIAQGTLTVSYFAKLMLLNIPYLCSIILPFAFYLGVLLAYGKLYADSEMIVLQTSGFSARRLLFYTMVIGFFVFILTAYLTLILNPFLVKKQGQILKNSTNNIISSIIPSEFKTFNDGKVILYASKVSSDKRRLQNIFLAQLNKKAKQPEQDIWVVNYMSSAHQIQKYSKAYLQTENGYEYKGSPGGLKYSIMKYSIYDILLPDTNIAGIYTGLDGIPTLQLIAMHSNLNLQGELQWRISLVIQVLILTLFVLPLSHVQPRQGRYNKILPAILFYFVYANLLFVGRYLFVNNITPPSLGLWWVHMAMLTIVGLYYMKKENWFRRLKR